MIWKQFKSSYKQYLIYNDIYVNLQYTLLFVIWDSAKFVCINTKYIIA